MHVKRFALIAGISAIVSFHAAQACAERLSAVTLAQIKDFIQFYKDDEKVLSMYRIIEDLCREEDDQADTIVNILDAARQENPSVASDMDRIKANFLKLAANDLEYVQDIFLYQTKTGKRFDLNFFHNLSVRSAMNAVRLQYKDSSRMPESVHELIKKIEKLRRVLLLTLKVI